MLFFVPLNFARAFKGSIKISRLEGKIIGIELTVAQFMSQYKLFDPTLFDPYIFFQVI